MDDKNKELMNAIKLLSEEDLESIASGGELSPKAKEILKLVGIGLAGAATVTLVGIGIAAYAGQRNYHNIFHYFGNTEMDRPQFKSMNS